MSGTNIRERRKATVIPSFPFPNLPNQPRKISRSMVFQVAYARFCIILPIDKSINQPILEDEGDFYYENILTLYPLILSIYLFVHSFYLYSFQLNCITLDGLQQFKNCKKAIYSNYIKYIKLTQININKMHRQGLKKSISQHNHCIGC